MEQADKLIRIMNKENFNMDDNPSNGKRSPRYVSVASGKGGVGKTNFCVNLSVHLAQMGRKVLILDADFGTANVNVLFGIHSKYTLIDVISGKKNIQDIVEKTDCGVHIIPGVSGLYDEIKEYSKDLEDLFKQLKILDGYDWILIDLGAGISQEVLNFMESSSMSIILTTPEPTSITDAYGLIKTLRNRNISANLKLVINRVSGMKEGKKIAERLMHVTSQLLGLKIEFLGYIPEDPLLVRSVFEQKPLMMKYRRSKAAKSIHDIVLSMENFDWEILHGQGRNNFFNLFFKRIFK